MRTLAIMGTATGAALLALLASAPLDAAELKVFPVRVILSPAEPVQTMTIENDGDAPARVQLRVFEWTQADGQDSFAETRDVLVNPLLFEVAPAGRQIARFGLRAPKGDKEKSYRVFLEEVPGSRPIRPGEVRTLLRISIPIFVPADKAEGRLTWQVVQAGAGKLAVRVRNEGDAHVQINSLRLSIGGREVAKKDLSVYVLPGAAQLIPLDGAIAPRDRLRIDARTDQGPLSTDIVAEAANRDAPAG